MYIMVYGLMQSIIWRLMEILILKALDDVVEAQVIITVEEFIIVWLIMITLRRI